MSLLYIVDGYNVINKSGLLRDKKLQDARSAFFSYICARRPQGSRRNKLIVIFDGSPDIFSYRYDLEFEVFFTQGQTADDEIKRRVEDSGNSKNIVVVTDDRDLAKAVRLGGARVMTVNDFLSKDNSGSGSIRKKNVQVEHSDLNIVEREKITQEMKKIWLKE